MPFTALGLLMHTSAIHHGWPFCSHLSRCYPKNSDGPCYVQQPSWQLCWSCIPGLMHSPDLSSRCSFSLTRLCSTSCCMDKSTCSLSPGSCYQKNGGRLLL